MPIHGIFYARFLPQLGTKIVAQSPPGCIVPVAVADESDDDDFDPSHWGDDAVISGAGSGSGSGSGSDGDSDSDGDALDIKATRTKRARPAYRPRGADSDAQSDAGSGAGSGAESDARAAAAAASASALLGTAASTSSSSGFRRAQLGKPLFDFDVMSEYVIPRPAFFNCYLAARDPSGKYAVLGLPVAIRDAKYHRNEFIFNFGIVVDAATDDQGPYERVVRRLASTFAEMEKQNEFLSREEQRAQRDKPGGGGGGIGEVLAAAAAHFNANADGTPLDSPAAQPHAQPHAHGSNSNSRTASIGNAGAPGAGTTTATAAADHNGHSPYHRRSIQSLLEIIKEDLNLYGECMIPVDDANTINMKLFPIHPNPPAVEGWHVPVPKMRLADAVDPSWDLTLQRVIAHMDGVSDVRRIAFEADISMELCRSALRHLLYYDTILLLDIFFFGSCYAPRPGIHDFVANVGGIVDECARYVCLGRHGEGGDAENAGKEQPPRDKQDRHRDKGKRRSGKNRKGKQDKESKSSQRAASDDDDDSLSDSSSSSSSSSPYGRPTRVSNFDLVRLMTSFCVGRSVTEWLKGHADAGFDVLRFVDVRRLVQFGVIKGCLYRVHKYVVSKQYLASLASGVSGVSGVAGPGADGTDPLQRYTDGQHHFDQIMTEQNITEADLVERLKRMPLPAGDLKIMYR